jgi:hypothetical protein
MIFSNQFKLIQRQKLSLHLRPRSRNQKLMIRYKSTISQIQLSMSQLLPYQMNRLLAKALNHLASRLFTRKLYQSQAILKAIRSLKIFNIKLHRVLLKSNTPLLMQIQLLLPTLIMQLKLIKSQQTLLLANQAKLLTLKLTRHLQVKLLLRKI